MRRTHVAVFVHLVWGTCDRLPLLTEAVRRPVYRAIEAKCRELKAEVIAIGGVEDHVHLVVELPATLAVADLMSQIKGASSHLVTHQAQTGQFFKWQGAYAAFSACRSQLEQLVTYIDQQADHHAAGRLFPDWELPVDSTPSPNSPSS